MRSRVIRINGYDFYAPCSHVTPSQVYPRSKHRGDKINCSRRVVSREKSSDIETNIHSLKFFRDSVFCSLLGNFKKNTWGDLYGSVFVRSKQIVFSRSGQKTFFSSSNWMYAIIYCDSYVFSMYSRRSLKHLLMQAANEMYTTWMID